MWEELSKRHVKRFLCFVLLCVWVLVFIPHCVKRKNEPWRLSFRFDHSDVTCGEGWPEGFSVWAVGVLQIVRGCISPCIKPWLFLTSDRRAKDTIFYSRQLYLTQTVPSKQQYDCVLSYLLVWRGHGIFFMCVCLFLCMFTFVSGYLQGRRETLWPNIHHPAILISAALSTFTPEGGSNQRAWFKSLGFKALGRDWTTLSHFSKKYSNLVHVRKSKWSPLTSSWLPCLTDRKRL